MVSSPEPLPAASGMLVQPPRAATVCEVDRARKRAASCNRARTSDLGYRNCPRSLTHARMNKLLTQSSPCEATRSSVGIPFRSPSAVKCGWKTVRLRNATSRSANGERRCVKAESCVASRPLRLHLAFSVVLLIEPGASRSVRSVRAYNLTSRLSRADRTKASIARMLLRELEGGSGTGVLLRTASANALTIS